ncbi:MAG: peptidylprolyl isomerase [Bdellovibrionota bacterium]
MKGLGLREAALIVVLAIAFFVTAAHGATGTVDKKTVLSKERVVLHTNAGDIVLALYPEVAPKHVEQILKMVEAGVYKDVSIFRLEPGFVAQIDSFNPNDKGVTNEQLDIVKDIPAEFSDIKHVRGLVSMARYDEPDSATSSFSFMLGSAPHLDGKYTVFGEIVEGMDVIGQIESVAVEGTKPLVPLRIKSAEIVSASALPSMVLVKAHAPELPGGKTRVFFILFAAAAFLLTVGTAVWKTIFDKPKVVVHTA